MNYSGKSEILKFIHIDILLTHFGIAEDIKSKYGHYLDRYSDLLNEIKNGKEIEITNFFSIDDVEEEDKKFFRRYTLLNRLYDYRNYAESKCGKGKMY